MPSITGNLRCGQPLTRQQNRHEHMHPPSLYKNTAADTRHLCHLPPAAGNFRAPQDLSFCDARTQHFRCRAVRGPHPTKTAIIA
eukprot:scaffold164469_cov17-Tisochrysis_lutea.AAC.1